MVEDATAVVAEEKEENKAQRLMETNLVQFTLEQITNGRIASRIQKVQTSKGVINKEEEDVFLQKEVDSAVAEDMAAVEEITTNNNTTTIIIINILININILQMILMRTIQRKLAMVAPTVQEILHYHHHHLVTIKVIKAIRIIIINNTINEEDLVGEEQVTAIAISVTAMALPTIPTILIQINLSLRRTGAY